MSHSNPQVRKEKKDEMRAARGRPPHPSNASSDSDKKKDPGKKPK